MLEYAQGVINVLEKNIFDKLDLQRMISSSNKEEAFMVLFDTDLGRGALAEEKIETILQRDFNNLRQSLFAMLKDIRIELFYFLFLKFEALDIKIALKEEKEPGISSKYAEKMMGLFDLEKGSIDQRIDRAYLKTRLLLAKKLKGVVLEIATCEIDIANLKNMIKGKEEFIKGGNLSYDDMSNLLGKKEDIALKGLERFLESFNLSLIIEQFKKSGSESDLEKSLEKFLAERVLQREREGGGMAKVVGFFFRKIDAHSNIRLIFFQKDSNLPIGEIENNLLPI
jgi:vacuolar-type H+-ATPase subunit C/Vma6